MNEEDAKMVERHDLRVTRNTLVPIGAVALLVSFIWWAANDRSNIVWRTEMLERRVDIMEVDARDFKATIRRIEDTLKDVAYALGVKPSSAVPKKDNVNEGQ